MSDNKKIWSFNESFLWQNDHHECGNSKQSPINIDTTIIQECNTLCDFETIYKEELNIARNFAWIFKG